MSLPGDPELEPMDLREMEHLDRRADQETVLRAPSFLLMLRQRLGSWIALAPEIGLIGAWALWVGRGYLNLQKYEWPFGREFGSQILTHHFWTQLQHCGVCALWNGAINGGIPALADVFGATLDPIVAIPTLIFGVVDGAKLAVVGSFLLAGVAQWWIARTLRLGRVARVWSALLVVVGGHLAGRLEVGAIDLVVSIATCSLALAAALALAVSGHRRYTILLALTGAMALVSGQGYLQLALLSWAPAFVLLILDRDLHLKIVWREFLLAGALAVLMAGVFLVPIMHFWPNLSKFNDPTFQSAQPLAYIPLNLVIGDFDFMRAQVLGKLPFPYLYNIYIGWVPVLLALGCLKLARRSDASILLCLAGGVLTMFLAASALPLQWLVQIVPELSGFRHPPLLASLAIPGIVALAAYATDRLLSLEWPQIVFRTGSGSRSISLAWSLSIPLILSLRGPYTLGQTFLKTTNVESVYEAVQDLSTPSLQWVAPPMGEHFWIEPSLDAGLKVANVVWAWGWKDRAFPEPRLVAGRDAQPEGTQTEGLMADVPVYLNPNAQYAFVDVGGQIEPCAAAGSGGNLSVSCSTTAAGILTVEENAWVGWSAWRDGEPTRLLPGRWLKVDAPAGEHDFRFNYRPWDVPIGLLISILGIGVTVWLWVGASRASEAG